MVGLLFSTMAIMVSAFNTINTNQDYTFQFKDSTDTTRTAIINLADTYQGISTLRNDSGFDNEQYGDSNGEYWSITFNNLNSDNPNKTITQYGRQPLSLYTFLNNTQDVPIFDIYIEYQNSTPRVRCLYYLPLNVSLDFHLYFYENVDGDILSSYSFKDDLIGSFYNATSRATFGNDTLLPSEKYTEIIHNLPNDFVYYSNSSMFEVGYEFYRNDVSPILYDVIDNSIGSSDYYLGYNQALTDTTGSGDYPDYEDGFNAGYQSGYNKASTVDEETVYNNGYKWGYDYGKQVGNQQGYNTGYTEGYDNAMEQVDTYYTNGYNTGYQEGYTSGISVQSYSFGDLFGAVADTPILVLRGFLDFDFFGVNVLTVVFSLITALMVLFILRKLI